MLFELKRKKSFSNTGRKERCCSNTISNKTSVLTVLACVAIPCDRQADICGLPRPLRLVRASELNLGDHTYLTDICSGLVLI